VASAVRGVAWAAARHVVQPDAPTTRAPIKTEIRFKAMYLSVASSMAEGVGFGGYILRQRLGPIPGVPACVPDRSGPARCVKGPVKIQGIPAGSAIEAYTYNTTGDRLTKALSGAAIGGAISASMENEGYSRPVANMTGATTGASLGAVIGGYVCGVSVKGMMTGAMKGGATGLGAAAIQSGLEAAIRAGNHCGCGK
jgi:hypothetical protein